VDFLLCASLGKFLISKNDCDFLHVFKYEEATSKCRTNRYHQEYVC